MTAATAKKTSPAKKSTSKSPQGKTKQKRKPRTITSSTPIYLQTLVDQAPRWYDGQDVDEHADALVDHLMTLGGNE